MKVQNYTVSSRGRLVIKVKFDDGWALWFFPFGKLMGYEGLGYVILLDPKEQQVARYNLLESSGGGTDKLVECKPPCTPGRFGLYWQAALDHFRPMVRRESDRGKAFPSDLKTVWEFVLTLPSTRAVKTLLH